jgi:hypothetical protein
MEFKFFQKVNELGPNQYLSFDMDEVLISVLKYKRHLNLDIINSSDTNLSNVNVPINNCWMRILTWRTITNVQPEMIEIDYRVFEINNTPFNFTARMSTVELLRRIEI